MRENISRFYCLSNCCRITLNLFLFFRRTSLAAVVCSRNVHGKLAEIDSTILVFGIVSGATHLNNQIRSDFSQFLPIWIHRSANNFILFFFLSLKHARYRWRPSTERHNVRFLDRKLHKSSHTCPICICFCVYFHFISSFLFCCCCLHWVRCSIQFYSSRRRHTLTQNAHSRTSYEHCVAGLVQCHRLT